MTYCVSTELCWTFSLGRFFFILTLLFVSCRTEVTLFNADQTKIGVNYRKIRGTIFKTNYPFNRFLVSDVDSTTRWIPNKDEIAEAEQILRSNIKEINKERVNQVENCPIIDKHINSYFRQYVGIKNERGERIIHINFVWDRYSIWNRIQRINDERLNYDSDYQTMLDGCSFYWAINVNLDENSLSDLSVNGIG